ncbi:MAG: hypothetical protein ACRECO_00965 [Xanthobacteraceae bacterium]
MSTSSGTSTMNSPAPVSTAAEADELAARYGEVMDRLVAIVKRETDLVREGHLAQAASLQAQKAELARLHISDALRLRASQAQMAEMMPDALETLRRRHDAFRALLQINLTVLATAHAVSEGIVRGVSGEMVRKSSPQSYGATGRANAPDPRTAQPLAVSRML